MLHLYFETKSGYNSKKLMGEYNELDEVYERIEEEKALKDK